MTDPTVPLEERMAIWAGVDALEQGIRPRVYDHMVPVLKQQFARNPISRVKSFNDAFPEPPGLEAWRQYLAQEAEKNVNKESNPSTSVERQ